MESIGGIFYLLIDGLLMAALIAVLCLGDRTPWLQAKAIRHAVLSVIIIGIFGLGSAFMLVTANVRKTKEQKDASQPPSLLQPVRNNQTPQ